MPALHASCGVEDPRPRMAQLSLCLVQLLLFALCLSACRASADGLVLSAHHTLCDTIRIYAPHNSGTRSVRGCFGEYSRSQRSVPGAAPTAPVYVMLRALHGQQCAGTKPGAPLLLFFNDRLGRWVVSDVASPHPPFAVAGAVVHVSTMPPWATLGSQWYAGYGSGGSSELRVVRELRVTCTQRAARQTPAPTPALPTPPLQPSRPRERAALCPHVKLVISAHADTRVELEAAARANNRAQAQDHGISTSVASGAALRRATIRQVSSCAGFYELQAPGARAGEGAKGTQLSEYKLMHTPGVQVGGATLWWQPNEMESNPSAFGQRAQSSGQGSWVLSRAVQTPPWMLVGPEPPAPPITRGQQRPWRWGPESVPVASWLGRVVGGGGAEFEKLLQSEGVRVSVRCASAVSVAAALAAEKARQAHVQATPVPASDIGLERSRGATVGIGAHAGATNTTAGTTTTAVPAAAKLAVAAWGAQAAVASATADDDDATSGGGYEHHRHVAAGVPGVGGAVSAAALWLQRRRHQRGGLKHSTSTQYNALGLPDVRGGASNEYLVDTFERFQREGIPLSPLAKSVLRGAHYFHKQRSGSQQAVSATVAGNAQWHQLLAMAVLLLSLLFMIHTVWQAMPAGSTYDDACHDRPDGARAEVTPILGSGVSNGSTKAEETLRDLGVLRTIPCAHDVAGDAPTPNFGDECEGEFDPYKPA